MSHYSNFNPQKQKRSILIILLLGAAAMVPVTLHDQAWTTYLNQNQYPAFVKFMSESIFEFESFGGGDISFLYVLVVLLAYLLSWVPEVASDKGKKRLGLFVRLLDKRPQLKHTLVSWRHFMGFQVLVGLFNSVLLVHSLKWVVGRARPYKIFSGELGFTDWYKVGPHFISEGWFHGSFPSGHTSTVFVIIALAYVLIFSGSSITVRRAGWGVGVFAFASATLMLLARSMTAAHWVSDSTFAIFAGWAVTHAVYFFGTHMPARVNYFRQTGKQLALPILYELVIALWLFVAAIGVMLFFFGVRAWVRAEMLYMIAAIPLGGWLVYLAVKKVRKMGFFNKRIFDEEVVKN